MLKILRDWNLVDFLRYFQGDRAYGLPIAKNYMAPQWYGAYTRKQRSIIYFLARKIDKGNEVVANYDIGVSYITYRDGQYLYDNTKIYDGILPDGVYFFEFNNGYETYRSQMFSVTAKASLFLASSVEPASSSKLVSEVNIENPNQIILKQFTDSEYVEFANG